MTDTPLSELPLPRHVLYNLGFFGHYLHMHAGGRSGQQHVLVKLFKSEGHLTQRELQESAGISSASVSEVLAKLECAGLIARQRSNEDRRQMDIKLTDAGRARAEDYIEEHRHFEARCLACLSTKEQEQLVAMLDRLVEHWKALEGKEGCA